MSIISSCNTVNRDNNLDPEDYCLKIQANIDSVIHERESSQDSLLLELVKECGDSPKFVELRLDILSNLKRFNEGLQYIESLDKNNFVKPYDSLVYSAFFKRNLTQDESEKLELVKNVVHEMEDRLIEFPFDTLALGNYCMYSLKFKSEEQIITELDSMARHNNFDGTYAFVVFLYFPDKQGIFNQMKLNWENEKSM